MLKFVKGYLENRTQRAVINNKHSKILPVKFSSSTRFSPWTPSIHSLYK